MSGSPTRPATRVATDEGMPVLTLRSRLRGSMAGQWIVERRHMRLSPTDAILASYPRSGNTWLRFMLFEALTGESAQFDNVGIGIPYVGKHREARPLLPSDGRLLKTHDCHRPPELRAVYVVRDVRDVILAMDRADGSQDPRAVRRFAAHVLDDGALPFGSWPHHVRYWLGDDYRGDERTHLVRFEDLRADPERQLRGVLEFLEVAPVDQWVHNAVTDNASKKMKIKEIRFRTGTASRERRTAQIGDGRIGGWDDRLEGSDLLAITSRAGEVLSALGYPVGDDRL